MSAKKAGKSRYCHCCDKRRGHAMFAVGNVLTCKECKSKCTPEFCHVAKQKKAVVLAALAAKVSA